MSGSRIIPTCGDRLVRNVALGYLKVLSGVEIPLAVLALRQIYVSHVIEACAERDISCHALPGPGSMGQHIADVTIHIDETLPAARRAAVLDEMRHYEGVIEVEANDEHPHLAVVKYDADKTQSLSILEKIKADGLHAELIGL